MAAAISKISSPEEFPDHVSTLKEMLQAKAARPNNVATRRVCVLA